MAVQKLYLATLIYFCLYSSLALAMRLSYENDVSKNDATINGLQQTCGGADEGETLEITCPNGFSVISIDFASYGNPIGTADCSTPSKGTCDSPNSLSVVQRACIGKNSCRITASDAEFGSTLCKDSKSLFVQASCFFKTIKK